MVEIGCESRFLADVGYMSYPRFIEPRLLGSLRGSLGTYGLAYKLCF